MQREMAPLYYDDFDIKLNIGNMYINILYLRFEPPVAGWNVDNHCHSSYELHFIPEGRGKLNVDNTYYDLMKGIFYLTGPGIYHQQTTDENCPMAEYSLSFEIKETKWKKHESGEADPEWNDICSAIYNTRFWFGQDEYSNIELFDKIFWELKNRHVGYYINIKSLIAQIIVNSSRCYMSEKQSSAAAPLKETYDSRRFLIDFQFAEFYKTLTFEKLTKVVGLSGRQLNRIIKEYYGMTFTEKLIETKLHMAKNMMAKTDLTIDRISSECGFNSLTYFYKVFKRYYGSTPSDMRTLLKKE